MPSASEAPHQLDEPTFEILETGPGNPGERNLFSVMEPSGFRDVFPSSVLSEG
jgi:hypothetical protein